MTHYLDASVCVAALTPERGTERVANWLSSHRADGLAISLWVHAEVASALSIKVRTASLSTEQRTAVLAAWSSLRQGLRMLDITERSFVTAAEMVARHDLGLRAGDALHLAVAAAAGCTLVTLAARMATAAREVGVPVVAMGG